MSDLLLTDLIKAIFVGRAGSGKTNAYHDICALTGKPALVIDTDTKIHTIKYLWKDDAPIKKIESHDEFDPANTTEIQHIPIGNRSWATMDKALRAITEQALIPEGGTLVLDSLSSLAFSTMDYLLSFRGDGRSVNNKTTKSIGDIVIPDIPEHQGEASYLRSIFTEIRDLPINVILTAHMTVATSTAIGGSGANAAPKETRTLMTGGPKSAASIPIFFDEIYAFESAPPRIRGVERPSYTAYSGPTSEIEIARTKLPLPYEMCITKGGKTLLTYIVEAQIEALS